MTNHKYSETTKDAMSQLKKLTTSLDGWQLNQEQDGVKIYNKKLSNPNEQPLVRGDTVFTNVPAGCTPASIIAVTLLEGCRTIWDERFAKAEVKEFFSPDESIFWVKQKAPWPVSPRDFACANISEHDDNESYNATVSIKDSRIPENSDAVRGTITISGWRAYWVDKKSIGLTFINQVDLNGSLPSSFLKKVYLQLPLTVRDVKNYINKHSFPPHIKVIDRNISFKGETYENDSKKYTTQFGVPQGSNGPVAEIVFSSKTYPKGVVVQWAAGQGEAEQTVDSNKNHRVVLKNVKGSQVSVTITKKK